jgi:hypothetical protein
LRITEKSFLELALVAVPCRAAHRFFVGKVRDAIGKKTHQFDL